MDVSFLELLGWVNVSAEWVSPGVLSHILREAPGQEARDIWHGPKVMCYLVTPV